MAQPKHDWQSPDRAWAEPHLANLAASGHRYEIVDGSLHIAPPADDNHHELADEIRTALRLAAPSGWRVIREIGLRMPTDNVIPDLTVLRPGASRGVAWHEPADVALVVEVESPGSRRHDRFTKPALYAEAGIESYWRIERGDDGPVAHVYRRNTPGHYELLGSIGPQGVLKVDLPFPVEVAPATWTG
nr:Uma2 family endonuclease [Micromonospora sp. DSM 115978]